MIKRANYILRLLIPLFLVFCTLPAVHDSGSRTVRSIEQSSSTDHFAPIVMDSAIGAVDLVHRTHFKFSDSDFHDALITDQKSIAPTTVSVCILSPFSDCFANKFELKAIPSRAPPRFIS